MKLKDDMLKRFSLANMAVLVIVIAVLAFHTLARASERDDLDNDDDYNHSKKGFHVIKKLANAMGGVGNVFNTQSQHNITTIQRFDPEQAVEPGGEFIHMVDIQRTLTIDLMNQRYHANWNVETFYPGIAKFDYTEIVNAEQGAIIGFDGFFAPPQSPMLSTRLGARQKQYFMTSVVTLVKHALTSPDQLKYLGVRKYKGQMHHVVSAPGLGQPVLFYVNTRTKLLAKVETLEDDSVYGDALFELRFGDWRSTGELVLPYKVNFMLDNKKIAIEDRSAIHLDLPISDELFAIPSELQVPVHPADFDWGIRSSQWFARIVPVGTGFDIPQDKPATVNISEVASKVYLVSGITYNSLLVEMADYLVIVDPVLYDDRTTVILAAIKEHWPTKPVKYVIASHFHADHIGGIRGYGAIGAKLIVAKNIEDYVEDIFERPHTVKPDSFSMIDEDDIEIITVKSDEPYILSDGVRNIRIMDIANRHAKGMLVPYVEDVKLIFTSDLYSPHVFGAPIPPLFAFWSHDLFDGLTAMGLSIDWIAGAHGGLTSYEQFAADVAVTPR